MKKLYLLLAALFAVNFTNAQPTIQWQKSLGGTDHDFANSIQQTTDGGYIVAGFSSSNDGDVTGHHGTTSDYDYWVVKLNATGTILWQKSLGGTNFEEGKSILQTDDGGYIVAGYSSSNDGDVTGHHGTTSTADYWVVKLNSTGTIEWQKSLGGTYDDNAASIQQTTDGGFIVAGYSYSNDGDVTGHHGTAGNRMDYWVVKLNMTGTIEWQKSLGGTYQDDGYSIQQTIDGGYIVAGGSLSNDGDVTGHHGTTNSPDYWVMKLNSTGTIAWQKSLGGTGSDEATSIQQTMDGGFIVAGYSYSNDGDVTGHYGTTSFDDYWTVKLNSMGTIEWQRSLGGTSYDGAISIQQTTDGGYIIAGFSGSNNEITIELPQTITNYELGIYNINGQEVKKLKAEGFDIQIDINDLPVGLYFVKAWNEQGVSIAKFVKE